MRAQIQPNHQQHIQQHIGQVDGQQHRERHAAVLGADKPADQHKVGQCRRQTDQANLKIGCEQS